MFPGFCRFSAKRVLTVFPTNPTLRRLRDQPWHRRLHRVLLDVEIDHPVPPQQHQRQHPLRARGTLEFAGAVLGINVPQRHLQALRIEETLRIAAALALRGRNSGT